MCREFSVLGGWPWASPEEPAGPSVSRGSMDWERSIAGARLPAPLAWTLMDSEAGLHYHGDDLNQNSGKQRCWLPNMRDWAGKLCFSKLFCCRELCRNFMICFGLFFFSCCRARSLDDLCHLFLPSCINIQGAGD